MLGKDHNQYGFIRSESWLEALEFGRKLYLRGFVIITDRVNRFMGWVPISLFEILPGRKQAQNSGVLPENA